MGIIWLTIIVIVLLFIFRPWQFFGMLLNDYIIKLLDRTIWFWLPLRAFWRLLKEFNEKHLK